MSCSRPFTPILFLLSLIPSGVNAQIVSAKLEDDGVIVKWKSDNLESYGIQRSLDLRRWLTVGQSQGDADETSYTDKASLPGNASAAYYRVRVVQANTTASPQGIPDDFRERRQRAKDRRSGDRPMIDDREVRTYDGSNNNLANPEWGSTFSHLQRLAENDYSDSISNMSGLSRASARIISNNVVSQDEGESIPNTFGGTDMVWQWGQFIDHDLDLTDGTEEEANIVVPAGDPFFDPTGTGLAVISFNRALYDPSTGTDISNPREQENEITSWIDGSMVYGSDDERALALRVSAESPFLATSEGNLLPFNTGELTNANGFIALPEDLFLAGDIRINEQLGLATMHTLWVREHNRLAAILEENEPEASAEDIFQQARRLVVAKIQKITYEEYLPALHGEDPLPAYTGYNAEVNPTIFNEFSVAAYRFGHSLVNEVLLRLDANGEEIEDGHLSLVSTFFTAPSILTEETSIDPILRGLAAQTHQKLDVNVVNPLRNSLFGDPLSGGLDLVSLNIQRGRDHGVPSYNDMREVMGLERYTDFSQITSDESVSAVLEATYADINDIDLWVGGISEEPVEDSQFGELFDEIILKQFQCVRDGDRFWYENHLTSSELERLEGVTLAKVIRDNTSIGSELSDNVFSTLD